MEPNESEYFMAPDGSVWVSEEDYRLYEAAALEQSSQIQQRIAQGEDPSKIAAEVEAQLRAYEEPTYGESSEMGGKSR